MTGPKIKPVPRKPPRPVHHLWCRWRFRLYLGDQCDWYVGGVVEAHSESEAIAMGRRVVTETWPVLAEIALTGPALAKQFSTP